MIEAIISLPPGLFYGTGIPACVIVANKNKPEALKDKVLFINADREYAEGKAQNKLRPEDIEKIDFVFTHKREIPKYSRLVDKAEIVGTHDYNLNIRRYVDNTPDPEPEDAGASDRRHPRGQGQRPCGRLCALRHTARYALSSPGGPVTSLSALGTPSPNSAFSESPPSRPYSKPTPPSVRLLPHTTTP